MLNTFALESSVLMLLNISLSNSMRRQSEDAVRRDGESSKKQQTQHREKNTRDRGTREETRGENKAQKKKTEELKDEAGGEEEGRTREPAIPFSGCLLFQVCLLLSVKP